MLGADEVAERSPWRVPECWSLVAVATADAAGKVSSLDKKGELLKRLDII